MGTPALGPALDQATLRVLYDALRSKHGDIVSGRIASSSRTYDAGVAKGIDTAIDVLVALNGGAPMAIAGGSSLRVSTAEGGE